jgi:NAD(P)-dependent dehydrogenase (short-subunit alcohol dehydrogenase family)
MSRVCVLTGASGPLGSAFIERHADRYQIVAIHHRRPVYFRTQDQEFVDPIQPSRELAANARRVHAIRVDLARQEELDAAVEAVLAAFGCVDLLINAAAARRFSPLLRAGSDAGAEEIFNVNVLAPLRFSLSLGRSCWGADPEANARSNRNVLNVGSTSGLFVYPDLGQALYASTKAALHHLTYHLASELWDLGIRVNAVAPDTFPGRVSIEAVLDAIIAFDQSAETGQVLALRDPD